MQELKFQIGKAGVNDNVVASIKNGLKNHKFMRISVLKSAGPNKDSVKAMADSICSKIRGVEVMRIIGHTIILRRNRLFVGVLEGKK